MPDSLNAKDIAAKIANIPQIHFVGDEDKTVSPALAQKLVHGLSEMHLRRLELFARKKQGRVSLKELLAVNGDSDWHALSHFQSVMTRRLRRLIDDPEKKAELVKWDFESTKWDSDGKTIVDGVYFVSQQTAAALREVLKAA